MKPDLVGFCNALYVHDLSHGDIKELAKEYGIVRDDYTYVDLNDYVVLPRDLPLQPFAHEDVPFINEIYKTIVEHFDGAKENALPRHAIDALKEPPSAELKPLPKHAIDALKEPDKSLQPAVGDGMTDDTIAMQKALDSKEA